MCIRDSLCTSPDLNDGSNAKYALLELKNKAKEVGLTINIYNKNAYPNKKGPGS